MSALLDFFIIYGKPLQQKGSTDIRGQEKLVEKIIVTFLFSTALELLFHVKF